MDFDNFQINTDLSMLQAITILNISADQIKVVIVFVNCMFFVTAMSYLFIYRYLTKYQQYEQIDQQW